MATLRGLQWRTLGVASLVSAATAGWLLGSGENFGLSHLRSHLIFAFGLGAALYLAIDRLLRRAVEHARDESASGAAVPPDARRDASFDAEIGTQRHVPLGASGKVAASGSEASELARRLDALGRTTDAVLHDVNNLLTAIGGHAELALRKLAPDAAARPELEGIAVAVERCARLTLPPQRNQLVLPRPLELNTIVLDMSRMLARLLGDRIELVVVPGASRSLLLADLGQIERLVLNLVVNARDAMPNGGVLRVLTENVERRPDPERSDPGGLGVALIVQDTGQGMDAATRSRLFEPGFSTRPAGQGAGHGLSTVQEVARQSSATIDCQTAPGRGTTFRVVFPLAHGPAATASARPATGATPGGRETVLLAERDPGVRELCRRVLGEAGYRVLEARDDAEALALTGDPSIRLLLADASRDGGDGPALAERLLLLCPQARVLGMSGHGDARRLPNQSADFLAKPFTRDELLRAVRRTLDRPAESRSLDSRSRVLVIDDDAEVRRVLHGLLEAAGFQVLAAPDGEQALELLARQPADVVLCDIFMPNKEGIETCAELRRRYPALAVIAMSGAVGASGYLRAAERLGAVASLLKPFTGQELVATVQGALADRARN